MTKAPVGRFFSVECEVCSVQLTADCKMARRQERKSARVPLQRRVSGLLTSE